MIVFGYFEAMGIFMVMFFTFFVAYLNGFHVHVYINKYGEAHVEWFMLCLTFDLILVGMWYMLKMVKKK